MNKSSIAIERSESLKVGTLAALSLSVTYVLLTIGNHLVLVAQFEELAALQITTTSDLLARIAIAFVSGFLFGITYRYVIREDDNPHLKDGAVLAFGLVRGLASVEVEQQLIDAFWLFSVLSIESILCFLIARLVLDWAFHHHWLKPLKSS